MGLFCIWGITKRKNNDLRAWLADRKDKTDFSVICGYLNKERQRLNVVLDIMNAVPKFYLDGIIADQSQPEMDKGFATK